MNLRNFYSAVCMLTISSVLAAPLTPEEALERVREAGSVAISTRSHSNPELKMTIDDKNGYSAVYVFENDNNGFLIVSADDSATPLLGYSDTGSFDPDNVPPALQYWLGEYTRQIEHIKNENHVFSSTRASKLPSDWAPITPMVKTKWNQNAPFNNLCPEMTNSNGEKAATGCVATAMAQVMKYFNYPTKGQNSIGFHCQTQTVNEDLYLNFSEVTFDWANMLDSYNGNYTPDQANAVATLMKAAGYSVKMMYSNESGAYSHDIAGALYNYFGYDQGVSTQYRDMYSYSDWAEMIYNNLKNCGPVIYNGASDSGGHSFVLDGYSKDGYFHFNWGWGGLSDGYFLLDALDPRSLGIGAGSGGYQYYQVGVFNIQKPVSSSKPQTMVYAIGNLDGSGHGNSFELYFKDLNEAGVYYQGISKLNFQFGIKIETEGSSAAPIYVPQKESGYYLFEPSDSRMNYYAFNNNPNTIEFDLASAKLSNTTKYKFTIVYRPLGSSAWEEIKVNSGCYNYIYVTKSKSGNLSQYAVVSNPIMNFNATNVEFLTDLYFDSSSKLNVSLNNPNQIELSRNISPVLISIKLNTYTAEFWGQSFLLTLAPGESFTGDWTTAWYPTNSSTKISSDTEFYLGLYSEETESLIYVSDSTVTMHAKEDVAYDAEIIIDTPTNEKNHYLIDNCNSFPVTTKISVTQGNFTNKVAVDVWKPDMSSLNSTTGQVSIRLLSRSPYDLIFIDEGNTENLIQNISIPDASIGENYIIACSFEKNGAWQNNFNDSKYYKWILINGVDGVEEIETLKDIAILYDRVNHKINIIGGESSIESVDIYHLNGTKLGIDVDYSGYNASVDLSSLGKGIVIITVVDHNGKRKTSKLAL